MGTWLPDEEAGGARKVGRPLLALSDVHGDLAALESVLDQVAELELCGVVAAGDHCLGGPRPFDVWQRLNTLGAHLVRGTSDLAIGTLSLDRVTPQSAREEARLLTFLRTREALGEIVCRRLAELPTTVVVSLDDRKGVMVMHGSPADEYRGLDVTMDDAEIRSLCGCVAEDVLVTGFTHVGFERRVALGDGFAGGGELLVVNAGAVGMSGVRSAQGERTAHAVLLQPWSDGVVRAYPRDVLVDERRATGPRSYGAVQRRVG
jgi:predicted phosphodiesterase